MRFFDFAVSLAVILVVSTTVFAQGGPKDDFSQATRIVRLLLEDERLQEYLPQATAKSPLKLANETRFDVTPDGLGFHTTLVAPGSSGSAEAFLVKKIVLSGNRASIHFRFRPQGLRGSATFRFTESPSRWTLTSIQIFET